MAAAKNNPETVGATEFREKFSTVLDEVRIDKKRYVVCNNGKSVALLTPVPKTVEDALGSLKPRTKPARKRTGKKGRGRRKTARKSSRV